MPEENVMWVKDAFSDAWVPMESFTQEELRALGEGVEL